MKNKYATIGIIITTVLLAGIAIFTALRLYQTRSQPVAPNAPSSKPAAAEICGGIAGKTCPSGYICRYPKTGPLPDQTGTCQIDTTKVGDLTNSMACSLTFALATASPSPTPSKSPSPSPTASPIAQCNSSCTSSSNCPSSLTCYIPNGSTSGNCRKAACTSETDCVCATASPSPTPTATPTKSPSPSPTASPIAQCNSSCTSNSNCPSSMICYIPSGSTAGSCRNSQCLSETDCSCPVATSTATTNPTYLAEAPAPTDAPSLPDAGTTWPTILGTGFGILVIIGSLLLAL